MEHDRNENLVNQDSSVENEQKTEVLQDEQSACDPDSDVNASEDREPLCEKEIADLSIDLFEEPSFSPVDDSALRVKAGKRFFSKIGFVWAIYTFVFLLSASCIALAVKMLAPDLAESMFFENALAPIALYVVGLPILLLFCTGIKKGEAPQKKKIGFGAWLLYLFVCIGMMYAGSQISQVLIGIFSLFGVDAMPETLGAMDTPGFIMYFIYCVIIAPLGEELVYRKLLIDRTRKFGCLVSVLLSGLTFGFMHGNLFQLFFACFVGFVMAYLYFHTGNIWLTIGIHAVINLISVFSYLINLKLAPMLEAASDVTAFISDVVSNDLVLLFVADYGFALIGLLLISQLYLAGFACAIAIPLAFRKSISFDKGTETLPRGKGFSVIFINAGMIVLFLIYLTEIVLSLLPN